MSNQNYKTAYAAANARLIEQFEPEDKRLFDDPVVKIFFSDYISKITKNNTARKVLSFMYNLPAVGLLEMQVCRTKYIDDVLKQEVNNGIDQVVILGAGFDTRGYRIEGLNKAQVVEVDLPIILDKKKNLLEKHLGSLPANVTYTSIDFNNEKLDVLYKSDKIDFSKPIFFIWEGVTQYLTKEAIEETLSFISSCAGGSVLIFTYIIKDVLEGTANAIGAEGLANLFKMSEQAWCFGLNPSEVGDFINQYKLELIEDVGASFFKNKYLIPRGREKEVSKIERIAYSKRI